MGWLAHCAWLKALQKRSARRGSSAWAGVGCFLVCFFLGVALALHVTSTGHSPQNSCQSAKMARVRCGHSTARSKPVGTNAKFKLTELTLFDCTQYMRLLSICFSTFFLRLPFGSRVDKVPPPFFGASPIDMGVSQKARKARKQWLLL